ncbi:ethyl tert-butyl ether degradation ethd [Stemphylium lycopersici]|uniref:Ethyl tert-butyl ether degradation ethd n=1 Tax=Stemphylium lycopersici TaxID=183478 RepID=A0A364MY57_STELY|nr:ethyl tert-butyl ether degradation ethd [Stemphylium lycopersici]
MSQISSQKVPMARRDDGLLDTAPKIDEQKPIASHNSLDSPLLRLPRELRDQIWTLSLTHTIKPIHKFGCNLITPNPPISLLQTCRQIYKEARRFLYPSLTITFRDRIKYEDWFHEFPSEKRYLIHSLQIRIDPLDMYAQAEVEDPGYDDDEEGDGGEEEFRTPTFRAFKNLERLELLVARVAIDGGEYEEEEEEELGGEEQVDEENTIKRFNMEEIEESKGNFENTMKEKNPGVKVTYTVLEGDGITGTKDQLAEALKRDDDARGLQATTIDTWNHGDIVPLAVKTSHTAEFGRTAPASHLINEKIIYWTMNTFFPTLQLFFESGRSCTIDGSRPPDAEIGLDPALRFKLTDCNYEEQGHVFKSILPNRFQHAGTGLVIQEAVLAERTSIALRPIDPSDAEHWATPDRSQLSILEEAHTVVGLRLKGMNGMAYIWAKAKDSSGGKAWGHVRIAGIRDDVPIPHVWSPEPKPGTERTVIVNDSIITPDRTEDQDRALPCPLKGVARQWRDDRTWPRGGGTWIEKVGYMRKELGDQHHLLPPPQQTPTMSGATAMVFYPRKEGSTFNAEYYVNKHMPLVEKHWKKHGLKSYTVCELNAESPYTYCVLTEWDSHDSVGKAMQDPATKEVMDDVVNFSSETPVVAHGPVIGRG